MKSVIRWGVENGPAVNTVMIGVMLVGAASFLAMRREVFPEFDLEIILVTVPYPGASPAEIEEGICQKVEEAVRSIDGIKKQTSVAQEGSGSLILELETSTDVQKALSEVRSEIDRIPSFPDLAEDPEIKQITLRKPAIRVGVIGPDRTDQKSALQLREVAEDVRADLLRLGTVSQANISGSHEYQIDIEIAEDTLRQYGLSLQDVANRVRRENLETPGGSIKTGTQEIIIRGKNKQLTGVGIERIPLVTQPDGVVLTVGELGNVRDAFVDTSAISFVNGLPGLQISVDRTSSEDLLAMVDQVKDYLANKELPPGYSLTSWGDESVDVRDRMELLIRNGLQGLLLVCLMLAIFLDLKLAFWVAMGIPIAVLGAGAVLLAMGETLNMLTMFAFLMALGIVVDDAIVVGENVFARRQTGADAVDAAIEGTYEVMPSVAASVSTTIIAFMPLLFVSGVMGKFLAVMPVAVIAMLLISLVECTLILPNHLAHRSEHSFPGRVLEGYLRLPAVLRWPLAVLLVACAVVIFHFAFPPKNLFHILALFVAGILVAIQLAYPLLQIVRFFHWLSDHAQEKLTYFIENRYLPVLKWSIRHPALIITGGISMILMSAALPVAGVVPYTLFPKTDANQIEARIMFPNGTAEQITDTASRQIMDAMYRVSEKSKNESGGGKLIRTVRRSVGEISADGPMGAETRAAGSHVGLVQVELVETGDRELSSEDIIKLWRNEAGEITGAESVVYATPQMGPGGVAIEFKLLAKGTNVDELESAVEACKEKLATFNGVVDIRDDSSPGKWEFQLKKKPKAEAMGISLAELAQTVRSSYYGEEVMRLQRGRHEVKLMVRYPPEQRRSVANLDEIRVRAFDGVEYPLTELAEVTVSRGYSEINRVDQQRSITITADVIETIANADDTVRSMRNDFMPELLAQHPNVSVRWEGQKEQSDESVGSMLAGLGIALLAMFVLLTMQFRSYAQPLLIMGVIPFGIIGAVWGHAIMGLPLTIFSIFGLIALTGVVVNDSIVLIDFINHRIGEGLSGTDALIEAGQRRFRPVLLTSVTTIAGLAPMLTETSFQAQFLIPLAATLVFGLSLSTLMVLILVPTYYGVYYRIRHGGLRTVAVA